MIGFFALPLLAAAGTAKLAPAVPIIEKKLCQRWDKPGTDCTMPPLKWDINIYRDGGRGWRELPDSSTLRDVWVLRSEVPANAVPRGLNGGTEPTTVNARLRVAVGPGGAVSACRPRTPEEVEFRKLDSRDPDVLAEACRIIRTHGKFRHAVAANGEALTRDVDVTVAFRWDRFDIPAVPAPPPPSGFARPANGDWPPATLPYGRVRIVEPDWGAHLTDRKKLPKESVTGVALTIAPGGQVTDCVVKLSSGDPRLDRASCAALSAQTHSMVDRVTAEGYPLVVRWRKAKAGLRLPSRGAAPDLPVPLAIPPDFERPPRRPEFSRVRVLIGIDAGGTINGCEIRSTSMDDAWDAASCAAVRRLTKPVPGRDVFGGATPGGLHLLVDWDKRTIGLDGYRN